MTLHSCHAPSSGHPQPGPGAAVACGAAGTACSAVAFDAGLPAQAAAITPARTRPALRPCRVTLRLRGWSTPWRASWMRIVVTGDVEMELVEKPMHDRRQKDPDR